MTPQQARELIERALAQVAPDADLAALPPEADFRDILQLDSLDFLSFVEALSDCTGYRIEEDDYPVFSTLAGGAGYLAAHAGTG
ncbi:acyl carrier protein [Nonomuraea sp. NPDC050680]|uniref:acyl carrier protein n=1 Tax=Nonomuraea sp. NPDC050680 TaxID=3154630 RepID=UPI0033D28CAA